MSVNHIIKKIDVHLVSARITSGIADATRAVDKIGMLVVRVTTDQGLEGIGVTYNETGGEATKVLIEKVMAPELIGRDPLANEVIWNEMAQYLRGVGRKGLMFCALSAIDIALWDLKGKIVNLPLYRLWGGTETHIPVYGSGGWTSYTDEELVEEVKRMVGMGYSTIKFKVGYGGGKKPLRDVQRVQKVRDAIGPDIGILLDANNCWDAATAVQFANRVKDCNIDLLEEPVFADDIYGLQEYKRKTDIPLGTGEHEYTKYGARDLLTMQAVDVLQIDGTRTGGFTELLKIGALAQAWNKKFAPHAMENIHHHIMSAMPNAYMLEHLLLFEDITSKVYASAPLPVNGYMDIPDLPGLGLSLNMDFIKDNED